MCENVTSWTITHLGIKPEDFESILKLLILLVIILVIGGIFWCHAVYYRNNSLAKTSPSDEIEEPERVYRISDSDTEDEDNNEDPSRMHTIELH